MKIKKILFFILSIVILASCNPKVEEKNEKETTQNKSKENTKEIEKEEEKPYYEGETELPLNGTTGFTTMAMNLNKEPEKESDFILEIPGGKAFEILDEHGEWWRITYEGQEGFIESESCLINLPDITPSIVYDGINTYKSRDKSSGKDIPGVTGEMIYPGTAYSERFEIKSFIMPVLYSTAIKIQKIQNEAIKNGETLVFYEGYRPMSAQEVMVEGLINLANKDPEVNKNINSPPWSLEWFAGEGITNHQYGYGVDLSLAKIDDRAVFETGDYKYLEITKYTVLEMPTPINELSIDSIVFTKPVDPSSSEEWKQATLAPTMNEAAIKLQKYATKEGLTPLASEWWHFNDLDGEKIMDESPIEGKYVFKNIRSKMPQKPRNEAEVNKVE